MSPSSPSAPVSARRPGVLTAAALLLVLCAVLQVSFFVLLAASDTGGGFLTQLLFTGAFWGLVCFAGVAVSVWRGSRAARALTWLVAVLAGPWCSILGSGVIDAISFPVAQGRLVTNGSVGLVSDTTVTVVTGIVMASSALAVAGALVLLSMPSSGRYLRRWRSVGQPSDPVAASN
ncbi:hypothetical protein [Micromonospora avicenniae]|uniref:hypothetical protein n=1 Tax=Micromonospora avicenniae TaxID=1198245 RepID=UPI003431E961